MLKAQKQSILDETREKLKDYSNLIVADYRGLTVEQITNLRKKLREKEFNFHVIKNTLLTIALSEVGVQESDTSDLLSGPTGVVWCKDDPVTPAKILADFGREFEALELKGALVDGQVLNQNDVVALSKLPTKDQIMGQIVGCINGPMVKLAQCFNGLNTKIAGLLSAYKDKLEEAA